MRFLSKGNLLIALKDAIILLHRLIINHLAEEYGEEHFCIAEALNNLAVLHCHVVNLLNDIEIHFNNFSFLIG